MSSNQLIYKEESFKIIGAAMAVHRWLGCGFSEKVYQDALEQEFIAQNIPYSRETSIHAKYKGVTLKTEFVPDFICYDKIIVELKAQKELEDQHRSQTINYVKIADFQLGLLINFGAPSLEHERMLNVQYHNSFNS
ncbi:MAG: GxxExxY protein [Bacteroidaceae bacterium]|nr:GxxExxY protein [Bacteroidaceae bacterium]